jgi:hypothetical protein
MKKNKTMWVFTSFLIAVWLSSCTAKQTRTFPDISTAYSITIIDNWSGLNPAAPINSLYILENPTDHIDDTQFQGSALFSAGGYSGTTKKETTQINVPKDVIKEFLHKLSQASPVNGNYEPFFEHTDDYPEITIRVLYGNAETIEFYTSSQGDEHIPWKVTYDSNSYVVNSGTPTQALEILKPYLAKDVLEKLVEQIK